MKRCAVIDLGTNIFHLIIAEADAHTPQGWRPVQRDRIPVQLAEEGLERIGQSAFQRGIEALLRFRQHTDHCGIAAAEVRAFGTAALRTAQNAPDFLRAVEQQTGIRPQVISGLREAELIFKGVRQAVPFPPHPVLVVDIGGGSVEFILAEAERVLWQQSFPVGTTVLFHRFHKSDPIAPAEVADLKAHLDDALSELWRALKRIPASTLIGAAGAFDTLDELLCPPAETADKSHAQIPLHGIEALCHELIATTLEERSRWPGLRPERRQTIVVGMVLIQHLLQRIGTEQVFNAKYSLKEGAIAECLTGQYDE